MLEKHIIHRDVKSTSSRLAFPRFRGPSKFVQRFKFLSLSSSKYVDKNAASFSPEKVQQGQSVLVECKQPNQSSSPQPETNESVLKEAGDQSSVEEANVTHGSIQKSTQLIVPDGTLSAPVVPLTTVELTAFTHPEAELQQILENIIHPNWWQQYQAIESTRRLIVHHPDVLSDQLDFVLPHICLACDSLRSAMSKNALMALGETLKYLYKQSATIHRLENIVDVLIRKSSCEKKFLRDAADATLEQLFLHLSRFSTLQLLLPYSKDLNPRACARASSTVAECLEQMQTTRGTLTDEEADDVLQALVHFRNGKDAEARSSSIRALKSIRRMLGNERMEHRAHSLLDTSTAQTVILESRSTPSHGTKNVHGSSLKDRIQRDRCIIDKQRKLQVQPDFLVVVEPCATKSQTEIHAPTSPEDDPTGAKNNIDFTATNDALVMKTGPMSPISTDKSRHLSSLVLSLENPLDVVLLP